VYEPGNEIAKEFLHVLEEMVAVNDDNRNGESATSGTILSKFHGKGDGGESHGGNSTHLQCKFLRRKLANFCETESAFLFIFPRVASCFVRCSFATSTTNP
jgi:hypothetical protein